MSNRNFTSGKPYRNRDQRDSYDQKAPRNRNYQNNGYENSQRSGNTPRYNHDRGSFNHRSGRNTGYMARNNDQYSTESTNFPQTSAWGTNDQSNYSTNVFNNNNNNEKVWDESSSRVHHDGVQSENNASDSYVPVVSGHINEVRGEPTVETSNVTLRVTGASPQFDDIFSRMLNSHPDKDTFLIQLKNCGNVSIEQNNFESRQSSSLSVNAEEFQMRTVQDYFSKTVVSSDDFQHSTTSYTTAKQEVGFSDTFYYYYHHHHYYSLCCLLTDPWT